MDNTQTKSVSDTCNGKRINFRDLSNIHPTSLKKSAAGALPKLKKEEIVNGPISDITGLPHEIEQSWQQSIASLNNLFSDMTFENDSATKFDEDGDFEKDKMLLAHTLTSFGGSEGMAGKKETVHDVNPVPITQLLQRSDEREGVQNADSNGGINKLPEQYLKSSIRINNRFTHVRRYKHTYFDSEGQEINESNQPCSGTTKLPSKTEIPPIISTHFHMKSLVNGKGGKGEKKWHSNNRTFNHFENWFSVVPENFAEHIAKRCRSGVIIDGFCGAGGNAIQFATKCNKVIAIDTDPEKIEMAKRNATIYGVTHRIEFIVGDFLTLVGSLKADVIFLSPPWGGSHLAKKHVYDVETALTPVSASELMKASRKITQNIVIYLPKNSNVSQLAKLAGPERPAEIQKCSLNGQVIAIAAYYGTLFNTQ